MGEKRETPDRDVYIRQLEALCDAQMQKPYEQINTPLILACTDLLIELCELPDTLTDEEVEERADALLLQTSKEQKVKPFRWKRTLITAACVLLLLVTCITSVYASGNNVRSLCRQAKEIFHKLYSGESVVIDGELRYASEVLWRYDTIEEMLASEDNPVLYPQVLPFGTVLDVVLLKDELGEQVFFGLDVTGISFLVKMNTALHPSDVLCPLLVVNGFSCYFVVEEVGFVQCHFAYDEDLYVVCAPSREQVILIIENLGGLPK